jgi:hypothetical protein
MTDPRASWDRVGEQLSGLGLKLKLHFEQAAKEGRPEDEDKIKQAFRTVGDAVEQAFAAVASAAQDEAARDDVRGVARSMMDALDESFAQLGDRFRSTVARERSDPEEGAGTDSP